MGQYIELGKPFGIYRDSTGIFHTTFPQFSYPMFTELRKFLKNKDAQQIATDEIIDISKKLIAKKNSDGKIQISLFDGQALDEDVSELLLNIADKIDGDSLLAIPEGESLEVFEGVTITREENGEINNLFLVTDAKSEEEFNIVPSTLNTLRFFRDYLKVLPENEPKHLSIDMDVRYDKAEKKWKSSLVILTDKVIRDIMNAPNEKVDNLKSGEEFRFGPVKRVPIDNYGRYLVNYIGRFNTDKESRPFQHLSYYDVTMNRHDQAMFQGKVFTFPDSWDKPGRTMLTSESTLNRSTHVVSDPGTGRLRLLTPIEAERLQGFEDDWTKSGMPDRMRYFCMGNALVVPMITRMGKVLDEIIDTEK